MLVESLSDSVVITSKLQSETHSHSYCKANYICFCYSNALCPWNSCQNKGRLWFFLELSSVGFVLVTVQEQFKKNKKDKRKDDSFKASEDAMLAETATSRGSSNQDPLSALSAPAQNQATTRHCCSSVQLNADGFSVSNTHSLGVITKVHLHTCTTEHANLVKFTPDCRNNGRISAFTLSCTQLYTAEIVKTGGILVLNFCR